MKKEDFHKGQKVWVYLIGNAARRKKTVEERIQEWEVVSVGRKYITARPKGMISGCETKFEIENDFRQVYQYGCADYVLYLQKEDILHDIWRSKTSTYIKKCCGFGSSVVGQMSDKDLQAVSDIFKKYDKDGEQK